MAGPCCQCSWIYAPVLPARTHTHAHSLDGWEGVQAERHIEGHGEARGAVRHMRRSAYKGQACRGKGTIHPFIPLFVRSFCYFCIPSFLPLCMQSFLHACMHWFTHAFIDSLMHAFIHSFTHSLTHSRMHSFTHSHMHPFSHRSSVHLSIHTFIHACMHSFIHSVVRSFVRTLSHADASHHDIGHIVYE